MQRAEDTAVSVDVYVGTAVDCRAVETLLSCREEREDVFAACIVPVVVPERATTRRVEELEALVGVLAARAVNVVEFVPLRAAATVPVDTGVADRVVTRLVLVFELFVAARAVVADVVALRDVLTVVAFRGTTLLVELELVVLFVLVRTFMGAFDCDGVVPGLRFVRIVLFIYGYKLLYVFALT